MRTPISKPCLVPFRRRTRMIVAVVMLGTFASAAMAWLINSPQSGPLLLTLDELKVEQRGLPQMIDRSTLGVVLPVHGDDDQVQRQLQTNIGDGLTESGLEHRWFNGRPIRPARTMSMIVTGYSPDERSCGNFADGITASGLSVWTNGMKLAAADTRVLPFGSMISVPGYDEDRVIPVLDRGGAIKGNRIDLLFPTHEIARQWGVQRVEVTIWEYADGQPNGFVPRYNRASAVKD